MFAFNYFYHQTEQTGWGRENSRESGLSSVEMVRWPICNLNFFVIFLLVRWGNPTALFPPCPSLSGGALPFSPEITCHLFAEATTTSRGVFSTRPHPVSSSRIAHGRTSALSLPGRRAGLTVLSFPREPSSWVAEMIPSQVSSYLSDKLLPGGKDRKFQGLAQYMLAPSPSLTPGLPS